MIRLSILSLFYLCILRYFPSLNDVADVCSTCVWYSYACVRCVFACKSVAAREKRSKVWAHVIKLSDSIRCNICSSVIMNKVGNTSNIMKHLLTKHDIYLQQCAVFTMSPISSSWDTFKSNVDSPVELHSRDHKSTLFPCALVSSLAS